MRFKEHELEVIYEAVRRLNIDRTALPFDPIILDNIRYRLTEKALPSRIQMMGKIIVHNKWLVKKGDTLHQLHNGIWEFGEVNPSNIGQRAITVMARHYCKNVDKVIITRRVTTY